MKIRFPIALFLLILFPLGLITALGVRLVQGELGQVDRAFDSLLVARLKQVDSQIQHLLEKNRRELLEVTSDPRFLDPVAAEYRKPIPLVKQWFLRDGAGNYLFSDSETGTAPSFLRQNVEIFSSQILSETPQSMHSTPPSSSLQNYSLGLNTRNQLVNTKSAAIPYGASRIVNLGPSGDGKNLMTGWFPWSEGPEFRLLFWVWKAEGSLFGADLDMEQFRNGMNALIMENQSFEGLPASGCITLSDARNRRILRWGTYDPRPREKPRVLLILREPLQTWNLQFHTPVETVIESLHSGVYFNLLAIVILSITVFGGLGFLVYRESTREMREALQRVNFVNHVSHELKTPLTNIRMYSELLQTQLGDHFPEEQELLKITVSEIHRLSRLIHNVLSFSKIVQGKVASVPRLFIPDRIIEETLDIFKPLLDSRGIQRTLDLDANEAVLLDRDIFDQILGNLISNVEKYAFRGKFIGIGSRISIPFLIVWVSDKGPGIARDKAEEIFLPFTRLDDRLSEGASGTGIGLTISRDLARNNGGELSLVWSNGKTLSPQVEIPDIPGNSGSCFMVRLMIKASGEEKPKEER